MGCFSAQEDTQNLKVCEYIQGANGESWSDVSSWYWQVFFNAGESDEQSWLSVVIAENI